MSFSGSASVSQSWRSSAKKSFAPRSTLSTFKWRTYEEDLCGVLEFAQEAHTIEVELSTSRILGTQYIGTDHQTQDQRVVETDAAGKLMGFDADKAVSGIKREFESQGPTATLTRPGRRHQGRRRRPAGFRSWRARIRAGFVGRLSRLGGRCREVSCADTGPSYWFWRYALPGKPRPGGLMVDREGHPIVTMLDGSVRKYVPQRPRLPRHRPKDPQTHRPTNQTHH